MIKCENLDTIFAMSEQKLTERLIDKKIVSRNAYYGKVPDGEKWPLGSGTRIKGYRLGRIGVPDDAGWRPIEDTICGTNACSFEPEVIQHGHGDYFYSLVQRDLRTDWLCIDSVSLREMGAQEIMHLENGLKNGSRYVHEEFRRSRYIQFCEHKLGSVVGLDADTELPIDYGSNCDNELIEDFFLFETRDSGEMDEGHIRVKVNPSQIEQVGELTLDALEFAKERLEYEDEAYLEDTTLLDTVLCDARVARKMANQEATEMGGSPFNGGNSYDMVNLSRRFGTNKVLRDYSLRRDIHAMRFYPDTAFNATLDAYDESDPDTWPRFFRVYPYIPVKAKVAGIEFVTNPNYLKAPFGISTIFMPSVMSVMSFPSLTGVSFAKKMDKNFSYEGVVQWQNPDWECNVNRDKGFFKMRFRLAARPYMTEYGYAWFHRIDRRIALAGNPCAIPAPGCTDEVTAYCFGGATTTLGENLAVDEG